MADRAVPEPSALGILLELLNSLNSCILSATARSSSRLGHGPLKAGARVRVPYALPSLFRLGRIEENSFWSRCVNDREACETH
jgi:hypothetical protein